MDVKCHTTLRPYLKGLTSGQKRSHLKSSDFKFSMFCRARPHYIVPTFSYSIAIIKLRLVRLVLQRVYRLYFCLHETQTSYHDILLSSKTVRLMTKPYVFEA